MSEYAIRTEYLTREFGEVRALDGVCFEVPAGSVFGFLGSNGARLEVLNTLDAANWMQIGLMALFTVVGANAGLFMLAQANFKPYKLILD